MVAFAVSLVVSFFSRRVCQDRAVRDVICISAVLVVPGSMSGK